MNNKKQSLMQNLVSLTKRRGFIFPGSEIYEGIGGIYDLGPLGVELVNNLKQLWCKNCHSRFREDTLNDNRLKTKAEKDKSLVVGRSTLDVACPNCGKSEWTQSRMFTLMFKTH